MPNDCKTFERLLSLSCHRSQSYLTLVYLFILSHDIEESRQTKDAPRYH